jgi:phage terminase large subunit-like protein
VPYDVWARDGWITVTQGDVVDYTKVRDDILEIKKFHNVVELDADRAFASMLLQELETAGITCVDVPQTFASLTDPLNQTEILLKGKEKLVSGEAPKPVSGTLLTGRMTHEPNPAARWCFGNTSVATNGQGFIKYVKEHRGKSVVRTKRIDLVASWVTGMARARFYKGSTSVYEQHGIRRL